MKKTAEGLINHCKRKLGTPYVYGAKGEALTQAVLDRLTRENPGTFSAAYIAKARKFLGRRCTDCSGLISWYTEIMRGSYNYHDTAAERSPISELDESMVGWALWKPGHIGVYIGDGWCIEAKGINYGTIESRVSSTPWQQVLKLKDIEYDNAKKSGWYDEDGGRRFYNGDTGEPVRNDWHQEPDGEWYWFDGAGMMVRNVWYQYNGNWYYMGLDGKMKKGQITIDGKWYILDQDGKMIRKPIVLTPDQDGALRYPRIIK